jgi:hypothetical protein
LRDALVFLMNWSVCEVFELIRWRNLMGYGMVYREISWGLESWSGYDRGRWKSIVCEVGLEQFWDELDSLISQEDLLLVEEEEGWHL